MIAGSTLATVLSAQQGGTGDIVASALRAGLSIVLNKPGSKQPICPLTAVARKRADLAAVERAYQAGTPRPHLAEHQCGIFHALLPEHADKARALVARLERTWGRLNVGIEPGASRVVCVDVDTAAERAAFEAWIGQPVELTVSSPGKQALDGSWTHRDGGHYWFTLPAGYSVPTGAQTGIWHPRDGFTVMWAGRQALIPPSVRTEGSYVYTGAAIVEAPARLLAAIDAYAVTLTERSERHQVPEDATAVDIWDAGLRWSEVLTQDGWIDTGKVDNCGCPVWTAPGEHASPKSGTAHEAECARFDTSTGWGPLHVWTDNPPEPLLAVTPTTVPDEWFTAADVNRPTSYRTMTKLTYLALMAGTTRSWMAAKLGIGGLDEDTAPVADQPLDVPLPPLERSSESTSDLGESTPSPYSPQALRVIENCQRIRDGLAPLPFLAESDETPNAANQDEPPLREVDQFETPDTADTAAPEPELQPWEKLLARAKSSAQLRTEPPLTPLIKGMLDQDATFRITGPSGAGKTFVTLDMAACLATDQPWHGKTTHAQDRPVVYVVAEGAAGFKRRLWAWEQENNGGAPIPAERLYVFDFAIQIKDQAGWEVFRQALQHLNPCLVVLDTQARVTVGMEENSATDMGIAVARIDLIRQENPGACVGTVHHTGHSGERGRGSTAVLGSVNTEIMISKDDKGQITISNEKQKDDAEFDDIVVSLRQVDIPDDLDRPAAVIEHGDPFEQPALARPEPLVRVPEGAEWPDVVRLAHGALAGFNGTGGWSLSDLMGEINGYVDLPPVPPERGRAETSVRRRTVRNAVDRMVDSGELERITKGSFRWP